MAYGAGSDVSSNNGFSFSRVSVLGLQRKCACGSVAGPTGECAECRRKRVLGLQPKLTVNQPGDAYEQEADRVAQAIMGSFSHPAQPEVEPEDEPHYPAEGDLMKGGERLPADVTEFYEARFGRDFSAVHVHTGETAMRYNDALNAYAFTYGSHIWLGPGLRPRPSHTLAHEMAHVVQQTQPAPLASALGQPNLSLARQSVQRSAPYWLPSKFVVKDKNARGKVGTETHKLVLPQIGKFNGIFTEAPVPNADSKGVGYDFEKEKGIADLYQASDETTTVGVFFADKKRPKNLGANRELKYKGKRYPHSEESAPQADEAKNNVLRAGNAPTTILVGDLKPSHGTPEAAEGPEQVQNYLKGFKFAHERVNEMSVGKGGDEQTDEKWKPLTTGIISIRIPPEFEEPSASGQEPQGLVLNYKGRIYHPPNARQQAKGKVYVKASPGGIWNYVWEPDTPVTAGELATYVHTRGGNVQKLLIDPLLVSPVQAAKKARPASRPSNLTPVPRHIQARARDKPAEDVKDSFDKVRFAQWNEDLSRLTGEEKQQEKTPAFEKAEFESLAIQDRQAAIKSGFRRPIVVPGEEKAVKTLDKIQLWTDARSKVFGKLRYHFGGVFVKIANAYYSIRARFQNLLKDKKGTPKKGGLPGTIIRIAFEVLKEAGQIMVGRTAKHLADSLSTGVERKLKSLIPEDKNEEFEAKVKEITDLADDLEQRAVETVDALVEKTVGPYMSHIETMADYADKLSTVTKVISAVRLGARAFACLAPPGWGCLWILAESVIEKFASWLVDNCSFKKQIAPLVTGVEFVADLPKKLARFIVDGIKGFLPDKPINLQDVFTNIDPSKIDTKIDPKEICSKDDRPTRRDRDLVERLALAELRNEIGEEKWQAWIEIAKLYGVNRGDFLTEEQIVQLKRELKKANLSDLKDAADMHEALQSSSSPKDVVNLTTLLERVAQVKQQMYGGGSGGQGGAGGISGSFGSKTPTANLVPSKQRWKIVAGVKRGQREGDVIKINLAALINNTPVTLDNFEVVVGKQRFIPNERNPEKIEVPLKVTKDQFVDLAEKNDPEAIKKAGLKKHYGFKEGAEFTHTLQLKGGKPEQ